MSKHITVKPRLPLWKLEVLKAQAERKFQRTEEAHRQAFLELEALRAQIEERHKEDQW